MDISSAYSSPWIYTHIFLEVPLFVFGVVLGSIGYLHFSGYDRFPKCSTGSFTIKSIYELALKFSRYRTNEYYELYHQDKKRNRPKPKNPLYFIPLLYESIQLLLFPLVVQVNW